MPAPPARCWTSAWPPCSTPTRRTWSGTRPRPAAPRPSRRKRLAARRRIAPPPIRPSTLPCPPTPWPAWPARSTPATPCLARRLPGAAAAGRVPRYLGQGQCQPPAAPIGTAGARQCRPAQFQQPGPPLAGADAPARPAICTSSCPTWTRWPGWSSSMARWPLLPKPRAVRPRLAPRVRARRLSPPPPSAAGPRRPDAPSDLRRARCPQ